MRVKDFYSEFFQQMYFGGFFFLCVDYSVVFYHSNTGIEIILRIYRNILQTYSQEDLRGIYVVVHINVMLLRLFVQLLISFPVLLCLVLNSIFHLILWFKMAF